MADGLEAAHRQDLVHRDIKPDNIWLEEGTGRVKIVDFGLVRSAESDADAGLTQAGMVLGTPRYMAPEQAQGQVVDHRCDLFTPGSVLYPASGKSPLRRKQHHRHVDRGRKRLRNQSRTPKGDRPDLAALDYASVVH